MKLKNAFFVVLFGMVLVNQATAQITIAFTSSQQAGGLGQNSNNTNWSTSGGFIFEAGAFTAGFTPTENNQASWSGSWTVAANGEITGTTTWINDGGATYFASTGAYASNTAPFTAGNQLYIWGYDSKSVTPSSQWILLTNTAWLVQTVGNPTTVFIDTTDSGTYAVTGSIANGGIDLKSAAVSAVPEPAAFATLFGLGALGFCAARRRRRVA